MLFLFPIEFDYLLIWASECLCREKPAWHVICTFMAASNSLDFIQVLGGRSYYIKWSSMGKFQVSVDFFFSLWFLPILWEFVNSDILVLYMQYGSEWRRGNPIKSFPRVPATERERGSFPPPERVSDTTRDGGSVLLYLVTKTQERGNVPIGDEPTLYPYSDTVGSNDGGYPAEDLKLKRLKSLTWRKISP